MSVARTLQTFEELHNAINQDTTSTEKALARDLPMDDTWMRLLGNESPPDFHELVSYTVSYCTSLYDWHETLIDLENSSLAVEEVHSCTVERHRMLESVVRQRLYNVDSFERIRPLLALESDTKNPLEVRLAEERIRTLLQTTVVGSHP